MKLAVMQPYFFPYIGYFTLIKHSDKFIIFDTPQFIRRGWIHRNRILNQQGQARYINASIHKAPVKTKIYDIELSDKLDWKSKIFEELEIYQGKAPYYDRVINFLKETLDYRTDSLSRLNYHTLKATCRFLNIKCDIDILSEMNLELGQVNEADEWGLEISKAMKAREYLNPPGAMHIFDRDKYSEDGIDLKFIKANIRPYDQMTDEFVPGLSIIDIMMFNSPEEINKMLDDYEVI